MRDPHNPQPDERRKQQRVRASCIVTYTLEKPIRVDLTLSDRTFTAVAVDISEGGMGVVLSEGIPRGQVISARFSLLNQDPTSGLEMRHWFHLVGRVQYCSEVHLAGYRGGLVFTSIPEEDIAFMREFVESHLLKERPL